MPLTAVERVFLSLRYLYKNHFKASVLCLCVVAFLIIGNWVDSARLTGTASWYGKKFHGRKTANGEIYNKWAMTAAHRHLPFNTMLEVTNLDNGEQVVVRINDRGPYWPGRIIDLSRGAAKKIKMVRPGLAQVKLKIINP
ncbi:MAG: septal ring lytic transglycosylase RlpA family protein [Candidatus Aceula meridiana]|nr:septal ring lytic transglycosylase RlpA family protein [Candidatus Aceula meridiana]